MSWDPGWPGLSCQGAGPRHLKLPYLLLSLHPLFLAKLGKWWVLICIPGVWFSPWAQDQDVGWEQEWGIWAPTAEAQSSLGGGLHRCQGRGRFCLVSESLSLSWAHAGLAQGPGWSERRVQSIGSEEVPFICLSWLNPGSRNLRLLALLYSVLVSFLGRLFPKVGANTPLSSSRPASLSHGGKRSSFQIIPTK